MSFIISGIGIHQGADTLELPDLVALAKGALMDAGHCITEDTARNFGIFIATTLSNYQIRKENANKYFDRGVRVLNPADFPKCLISYLGGSLAVQLKICGANSTVSSGVSAGADALAHALCFVRKHTARKALVLEIGERFNLKKQVVFFGATCLVVEHAKGKKNVYARICGLESLFEAKGQTTSLCRAAVVVITRHKLQKKLLVCHVDLKLSSVCINKIRKDFPRFRLLAQRKRDQDGCSGLAFVAQQLEKKNTCNNHKKMLALSMFLLHGDDSNSTCLLTQHT